MCAVWCVLCIVYCVLYIVWCVLRIVYGVTWLCTVYCVMRIVYCVLCHVQWVICIVCCVLCIVYYVNQFEQLLNYDKHYRRHMTRGPASVGFEHATLRRLVLSRKICWCAHQPQERECNQSLAEALRLANSTATMKPPKLRDGTHSDGVKKLQFAQVRSRQAVHPLYTSNGIYCSEIDGHTRCVVYMGVRVCVHGCMCMRVCVCICMHVRIDSCMYVCMYVCVYVCM